jgi:hypothetical protein
MKAIRDHVLRSGAAEQLVLFPDEVGIETALCCHCGRYYKASEEPDPCIGRFLSGVAACCCGHGDLSQAYVDLDSAWDESRAAARASGNEMDWRQILFRHRLRGEAAIAFFLKEGCGPAAAGTSCSHEFPA